MTSTILWFRRDLRLYDNPALRWVLKHSETILPVYIHDDSKHQFWPEGGASRWWLHHSLQKLQKNLDAHDLKLHLFKGETTRVLSELINKTAATRLVFNRRYEPDQRMLERGIDAACKRDIEILRFNSGILFQPEDIVNQQGMPYRVYTPFMKKLRPMLEQIVDFDGMKSPFKGRRKVSGTATDTSCTLDELGLLAGYPWYGKLEACWEPGEKAAHRSLDAFIDEDAANYAEHRDFPASPTTSTLSPHLHFGEISPHTVIAHALSLLSTTRPEKSRASIETFIKQVLWREFAYHVMYHFPETQAQPMDSRFGNDFWCDDEAALKRWQRGETGVPIIDAGMKQLWETGWMHNRVRMIVSSYLTKNLGIHWLHGARWFWDTLVDADLPNNTMGWQWVAGCGVDAAPYYRIFNPYTQAQRFDGHGEYTRRWLGQARASSTAEPLADIMTSRQAALDRYKAVIKTHI